MLEVSYASEDHCETVLIRGSDDFFITHGAAWLDHGGDSMLRGFINTVTKWEEGI